MPRSYSSLASLSSSYVDIGVAAVALLPDRHSLIWRDKTAKFFREGVPVQGNVCSRPRYEKASFASRDDRQLAGISRLL